MVRKICELPYGVLIYDNTMSKTCKGYECGSTKVIMTLPEFGDLCRGCYEELKDNGQIKTVYIQGDY